MEQTTIAEIVAAAEADKQRIAEEASKRIADALSEFENQFVNADRRVFARKEDWLDAIADREARWRELCAARHAAGLNNDGSKRAKRKPRPPED